MNPTLPNGDISNGPVHQNGVSTATEEDQTSLLGDNSASDQSSAKNANVSQSETSNLNSTGDDGDTPNTHGVKIESVEHYKKEKSLGKFMKQTFRRLLTLQYL